MFSFLIRGNNLFYPEQTKNMERTFLSSLSGQHCLFWWILPFSSAPWFSRWCLFIFVAVAVSVYYVVGSWKETRHSTASSSSTEPISLQVPSSISSGTFYIGLIVLTRLKIAKNSQRLYCLTNTLMLQDASSGHCYCYIIELSITLSWYVSWRYQYRSASRSPAFNNPTDSYMSPHQRWTLHCIGLFGFWNFNWYTINRHPMNVLS
jgi:hypothetical protein